MSGKVKLNKIEIFFIVLTVIAVVFTCGYFVGRGGMSKNVTVSVSENVSQTESEAKVKISEKAPSAKASGKTVSSDTAGEAVIVNINTAGEDELSALPSIGNVLSQRIIEYREENGAFARCEDIINVYGIGTAIYEKIKDRITV